jgi:SAM-dependent methyltransferase
MICPVLRSLDGFDTKSFVEFAKKYTPYVKSVFVNVQPKTTNVVLGEKCIHLWGDTTISDSLCGLDFKISPLSFYQVNHRCASTIYQKAAELAELNGTETILDLYCGTGTIGLSMAKKAKALYGIEVVADAVENARTNAKNNNITNAKFICADADEGIAALLKEGIEAAFYHVNAVVAKADANAPLIEDDARDFFINNIMTQYDRASDEKKMEIVMTQKWVANFYNPIEAYNDIRRTGYPVLFSGNEERKAVSPFDHTVEATDLTAEGGAELAIFKIADYPRVLWYPQDECDVNPNITNSGRNITVSNLFWDVD